MNLKKLIFYSTVGTSALLFSFNLETPAQAATWHKGVPTFLKHSFYRTKLGPKYFTVQGKKVKNGNLRRYEGIRTYKSKILFEGAQYNMSLSKCKYKHKGKTFIILGKFNKTDDSRPALKIIKHSKKKLSVSAGEQYHRSSKPNFFRLEKMTKIK